MTHPRDENFYDADETALQERNEKERQQEKARRDDDMRWILSNVKGRRILGYLLNFTGTLRPSYSPKDAHQTAYNEGRRSVGLEFASLIEEANPKALGQMQDDILTEIGKKRKAEKNG